MDSGALLLGVDIGTYETKAVLVDDKGRALACARSVHSVEVPSAGFAEHDAEKSWWAGLATSVSEVLKRWGGPVWRVAAISCSGIGPCVLPVDARLRPLRPAVLYGIDTRATVEIAELTRRLGLEKLLEKCGRLLSSQSAGPKIWWLKRHEPPLAASAAYFLTSHSYVVARMTGEVVVDHATASYFDPLYDQVAGKWDTSGCEDFVRAEQLPRLCWPSDVAGLLGSEAARELGLPEGIPVMVGTADAVAEGVACGAVEPGDMMIMYGSSSFMIGVTDRPCFGPELWNAPYAFAGIASLTAGTATAGTATRWICNLLALGDSNVPGSEFEELMELAAQSCIGANGVMVLPQLSGERTPVYDPSARAALVGLSLTTGRADVARALLEGVAHSMAGALAAYPRAGFVPKRLLATGGGTNNELWVKSVSDISGYTQQIVDGAGAAQGSAAIAAIGVGALDAGSCGAWAHLGAVVIPDPRAHELLAVAQDDYWRLYTALRQARRPARTEDDGL
jgi:xylulokinase